MSQITKGKLLFEYIDTNVKTYFVIWPIEMLFSVSAMFAQGIT